MEEAGASGRNETPRGVHCAVSSSRVRQAVARERGGDEVGGRRFERKAGRLRRVAGAVCVRDVDLM